MGFLLGLLALQVKCRFWLLLLCLGSLLTEIEVLLRLGGLVSTAAGESGNRQFHALDFWHID